VSRKWSGKTLTDHRADRRRHVLAALGQDPDNVGDKTRDRYHWEHARPDHLPPLGHRLLRAIAQRHQWRAAYRVARDGDPPLGSGGAAGVWGSAPVGESFGTAVRHE
jgi:hypothetical protein